MILILILPFDHNIVHPLNVCLCVRETEIEKVHTEPLSLFGGLFQDQHRDD